MKKTILYLSAFLTLLGCTTPTEGPAGSSLTGDLLRKDVRAEIRTLEDICTLLGHKGMPTAEGPKFINYQTTLIPQTSADPWEEIWSIQREGYVVKYEIRFIPLQEGGYKFRVSALFDEDDYK
jgi:hypothetical protein